MLEKVSDAEGLQYGLAGIMQQIGKLLKTKKMKRRKDGQSKAPPKRFLPGQQKRTHRQQREKLWKEELEQLLSTVESVRTPGKDMW
jgi:hypothetical protein